MARRSGTAAIAAMLALIAPAVSAPQHRSGSSQPHAGGAGAVAEDRSAGLTTGSAQLGSGRAATPPSTSMDAALKAENQLLDRKLRSICRGC